MASSMGPWPDPPGPKSVRSLGFLSAFSRMLSRAAPTTPPTDPRVLPGCPPGTPRVSPDVSRVSPGYHSGVSRVSPGCLSGVSRVSPGLDPDWNLVWGSVPRAMQVVEACDDVVLYIKGQSSAMGGRPPPASHRALSPERPARLFS